MIVGRNLENSKQCLYVVFPLRPRESKNRAVHKKYQKGTQPCVNHRIAGIFSDSPIGKRFESGTQLLAHIAKSQGVYPKESHS